MLVRVGWDRAGVEGSYHHHALADLVSRPFPASCACAGFALPCSLQPPTKCSPSSRDTLLTPWYWEVLN